MKFVVVILDDTVLRPLKEAYLCRTQRNNIVCLPYVPSLPVLVFIKCSECSFLSVSGHGMRMHLFRAHKRCSKEVARKAPIEWVKLKRQTFWRRSS